MDQFQQSFPVRLEHIDHLHHRNVFNDIAFGSGLLTERTYLL